MSFLINPYALAVTSSGLSFVASTGGGNTTTDPYTISLAGLGIQPGDIVIVVAGDINNGTSQASITCSGNNNGAYTTNLATSEGSDSWDCTFKSFYKIQGGTVDTQLSIGRNSGCYSSSCAVHVWRGANATPMDATTTSATGTNTGRGDPPAITPVTTGAVVLACGVGAQPPGGSAFTVPSGMSNGQSNYTDGGVSGCGIFIASYAWTSGSYDPAAWTGGTDDVRASWIAHTIALKPA